MVGSAAVRAAPTTRMRAASSPMVAGECVFVSAVVWGSAYVAMFVVCFVCLEMIELLRSAWGQRAMIPMTRIVAVVDMAVKAVGTVIPGPSPKKHSAREPVWPVVTVGRAVIGSVVKVTVGTDRRDTDADRHLGWGDGCAA